MPKFAFVLVVVAVAVCVQGAPVFEDDVSAAAASGNWDKVHEILRRHFANIGTGKSGNGFATADVRSLKPPGGGHVYAEAESSFQHASNYNGQVSRESGGHKVVNNDGRVQEWDFKP